MQDNDFSIIPTMQGKCRGFNIRIFALGGICGAGLRAVLLPSVCHYRVGLIPGH